MKNINHLRPHEVFDRVNVDNHQAIICLPYRHSLTTMLERAILVALLKTTTPKTVFEFGTYLGETTLMLSANTEAKVFSLDLPDKHWENADSKLDNFEQTNAKQRTTQALQFVGSPYEDRIERLFGDSTIYDFSRLYKKMEFILIDGGHHIEVVKHDTEEAFKMLSERSHACILWHDYGNPEYEITKYLDELSLRFDLHHVEETSYVFYANQK